jgi:serine/threonine protein kinase
MSLTSAVEKLITPLDAREDFDNEGRVLSFLRLIRHPSIVRFIGSYSYRDTYNLLFERAESGDLAMLLDRQRRPPAFETDDTFFHAMQGLCEALASFHHLTHPEYELEMKGYHHDLKPENILVHGPNFLLSDFGLSSLKDFKANSKTLSRVVAGYYISPECEDFEEGFKSRMIGQPNDIWALGCILAVILTSIRRGSEGVQEFERQRKYKCGNWTLYTFHRMGAEHASVHSWLNELEDGASPEAVGLIQLIRDMLKIDPSQRPDASVVSSSMDYLTANSMYRSTLVCFDRLIERLGDALLSWERDRLALFGQAVGLEADGYRWEKLSGILTGVFDFKIFKSTLLDLQNILNLPFAPIRSSHLKDVRASIDKLWHLLDPTVRSKLRNTIEARIVGTVDLALLDAVQGRFKDQEAYNNIGLILAIKSMVLLADQGKLKDDSLEFTADSVNIIEPAVGPFSNQAWIKDPETGISKRYLVEWLEYDFQWQKSIGEELLLRVQSIATILHDEKKAAHVRTLRCWKFYHCVSRHSFGLIFEIPSGAGADGTMEQGQPTTLANLITRTRINRQRPDLGKLFEIAKVLTKSVLEWHKIGWVHRRISSFSIVFFQSNLDRPFATIADPTFLGFQFSRPIEDNTFTTGPPVQGDLRDSCHPDYLRGDVRHRPEFDYYSLGLVLLELGFWKPLSLIIQKFDEEDRSPESLRKWILANPVEELHMAMGKKYQDAVRACLTFQSDVSSVQDFLVPRDVLEEFEETVLLKLGRCCA